MTFGKWCPFASIWVPTTASTSPAWTRSSNASSEPRRRVASRSIRATRRPSILRSSALATRSVPSPRRRTFFEPHPGHSSIRRALRGAVVAAHPPVLAVEHEVRVAPVAVRDPAAREAHEPGRVAAPVDEQERLLGPGLRLLQRVDEHVAQTVVEGPRAQVDDVDARRGGSAGAVRQFELAVAPAPDVLDGLQRRGGAAEHDRGAGVSGAHHREVARGVPEPVLLLEREVVLLVDDEESRARERHEHRGASTH